MRLTATQMRILDGLENHWRVLEPGDSRLVVLHGRPGTGKTAIVHEFYRRLVERTNSDMPSFWPPEIPPASTPRGHARKLVRPLSPAEPFGLLPFAWFGRPCRDGEDEPGAFGELGELVADEVAQALYVNLGQADRDMGREALVVLLAFVSAGGAGLAFGPAGVAAGAAVSWATFGHGFTRLLRLVLSEEAQWHAAAERVGRLPWAPVTTRNQMLVRRLERLAQLGIPAVLAFEDAHLAGEATVALCRSILASEGTQVLIVATAESSALIEQMEHSRGFGSLLSDSGGRRHAATLRVQDPSEAELEHIAAELLPGADWATRRLVIRAAEGSIEATVEGAEEVAIGLTPEHTADTSIERRWEGLDLDLQRYLASVAALQGEVWYRDQPLDQLPVLARPTQDDCEFRAVADGLLVSLDEFRLAFSDRRLYRLAKARAAQMVPSEQLAACRRDLFESISADKADQQTWDPLPPPVKATMLRTHCGLYPELGEEQPRSNDGVFPEASDDELEDVIDELIDSQDRLAGIAASTDELLEATRAAARAVNLLDRARRRGGFVGAQRAVQVQARYAYLPLAGRELGDVFDDARAFTDNMRHKYGADSVEYLTARWNEACLHAVVYDFVRAQTIAGEVIDAASENVDLDAVLGWRHDHGHWTGLSGRPDLAVKLLRDLLPRVQARLSPDSSLSLTTRSLLAHWLGQEGRVAEAVAELQALLADQQRVLGPDHPDTLTTRNNLALWLGEEGQVAEAVEQLHALLADRLRVLGADHPDTLSTRSNLAGWQGRQGRVAEAVEQLHALLADQQRVLGADHPDTLATRDSLALARQAHEAEGDHSA